MKSVSIESHSLASMGSSRTGACDEGDVISSLTGLIRKNPSTNPRKSGVNINHETQRERLFATEMTTGWGVVKFVNYPSS